MLKLFVSHSSADRILVEPLVDLLRSSLLLSANDIRCTSVDGYRLPGGSKTDEQIRVEVDTAQTFVGVISAASLKSMYVSFELGARWGAGKHLLPVLAPGIDSNVLPAPLGAFNALRLDSAAQLHQLVDDLARELGRRAQPAAGYQRHVDTLLQLAAKLNAVHSQQPAASSSSDRRPEPPTLKDIELAALKIVADLGYAPLGSVAEQLRVSLDKAAYYLEELRSTHNLVDKFYNLGPGPMTQYYLTHDGRGFLIERNVIT